VVGARDFLYSKSVQSGSEAHPALFICYGASLPGVKWPGFGVDNPLAFSTEVKERVKL